MPVSIYMGGDSDEENVNNFKRQIKMLGFSYDWDREINTTDEKYYKWKQWICHNDSNQIFAIFANSPLAKGFIDTPFYYLPDYINKFTLKELGITYECLIVKFISEGLLPKNFFELKNPNNLDEYVAIAVTKITKGILFANSIIFST